MFGVGYNLMDLKPNCSVKTRETSSIAACVGALFPDGRASDPSEICTKFSMGYNMVNLKVKWIVEMRQTPNIVACVGALYLVVELGGCINPAPCKRSNRDIGLRSQYFMASWNRAFSSAVGRFTTDR